MLSCVLNSPRAILVNIQVIRIFTRLREMIRDTNALEIKVEKINDQLDKQGESIKLIFTYLNELIGNEKDPPPRKRIGFRQ
jgi:hypothetical protein